jgi:hypothetical protein
LFELKLYYSLAFNFCNRTKITDFTDTQDLLQLSESLSFDDLKITQGEGENTADTFISLNNNEPIAMISGVSAELVTIEDFVNLSG